MPTYPQGAVDIVDAPGAQAAARTLAEARELAVDLEADAMHAFRARLCFLQVGTDSEVFLFDTLAPGVDARLLAPLMADPERTKFFHAAQGDLQYLAEAGVRVQGLFDTHRAATLLGWPKVGLADIARERLGVELPKEHQQSDFSLRPVPPGMRDYIANDVRYLCELGRQVREECRKADILEEVLLDCQRLCDEAVVRPDTGAELQAEAAQVGAQARAAAAGHGGGARAAPQAAGVGGEGQRAHGADAVQHGHHRHRDEAAHQQQGAGAGRGRAGLLRARARRGGARHRPGAGGQIPEARAAARAGREGRGRRIRTGASARRRSRPSARRRPPSAR